MPEKKREMMKNVVLGVCCVFASSIVLAQTQTMTEQQCKKNVEASLSAIDWMSQMQGQQKKLGDLSVEDIKNIQATRGSCEAMLQINQRTISAK